MNLLTLEELAVGRGDTVLEVGFGGGGLLAMLVRAAPGEIHGVDVSKAMVARARRRFRRDARVHIHYASAEVLPLTDRSLDKACSVNALYFWLDPAAAMAEFARVLRPGGRVVLCFEPARELRKWPGHEYGFRLYEGHEVQRLLADAGFGDFRAEWGKGRKPDLFLCLSATRLGAEKGA